MGTKNNPGAFDCYESAHPDEPMFVLLGRDPMAGALVRQWAKWRRAAEDSADKIEEAERCAVAMDEWARACDKRPFVDGMDRMRAPVAQVVAFGTDAEQKQKCGATDSVLAGSCERTPGHDWRHAVGGSSWAQSPMPPIGGATICLECGAPVRGTYRQCGRSNACKLEIAYCAAHGGDVRTQREMLLHHAEKHP